MYHSVGDEWLTARDFCNHLRYLKRNFNIVRLADLVALHQAPQASFSHEVALTFDDGLRNNCTVAYPLLKEINIPATFFISPGLIERREWVWTNEARYRLRFLSKETLKELAAHWEIPGQPSAAESILTWLKFSTKNSDRLRLFRELRDVSKAYRPTPAQERECEMMSWDDLKMLDSRLIEIGAHTTNHTILSGCCERELDEEITDCQRWLQHRWGRPIRSFSYPCSGYNEAAISRVRQLFDYAVIAENGVLQKGDDIHLLNRIPTGDTVQYLSWRMHRPNS
jgi:peptidoglycan/xylan/chitin deacetylase (PgdA/CDA1 family)